MSDGPTTPRRSRAKVFLPLAVLAAGVTGAVAMVALKPDVATRPPERRPPAVRTVTVHLEDVRLDVESQGTVRPRTETQLIPEVGGRIVWVAPSFASGGFFEKGEPLVRLDPHDYRQAVVRAEAEVARARLRLAQEEAEARVARKEWEELGRGEPTALTLRGPQLDEARAALAAAEAALETARRNLERTTLRAPYAGRVQDKLADVGQFVAVGVPVATLYAVDAAEVRLPLSADDLAFVDIPLDYRGEARRIGPPVTLRATIGGRLHEWRGRIVRAEGRFDPSTRMLHVVARVENPYGRGGPPDRPPLAVGLFVEAIIEGRTVKRAAVLPRAALREGERVWVVDEEGRLSFRSVELVRATEKSVVVASGLAEGQRVVVSPLAVVTDGMRVRVFEEDAAPSGSEPGEAP